MERNSKLCSRNDIRHISRKKHKKTRKHAQTKKKPSKSENRNGKLQYPHPTMWALATSRTTWTPTSRQYPTGINRNPPETERTVRCAAWLWRPRHISPPRIPATNPSPNGLGPLLAVTVTTSIHGHNEPCSLGSVIYIIPYARRPALRFPLSAFAVGASGFTGAMRHMQAH